MTKTDLQKELLEKVKPGTKPSNIKRQNIKPKSDKDDGYESDSSNKSIPTPPIAPNQQIKILQEQVSSLKKQLQTYKDFKEADLKIKEKYKGEIKQLTQELDNTKKRLRESFEERSLMNKTISDLQNQVNDSQRSKSKGEVKQQPIKTFNCYHCKKEQAIPLLVLELPEGKLCQPCWTILRKKTKEQANPTLNTSQLFTCVACEEEKQETPIYKKVEISYKPHLIKGKEYPICSSCSPHVKEYNEDENRELEEGE